MSNPKTVIHKKDITDKFAMDFGCNKRNSMVEKKNLACKLVIYKYPYVFLGKRYSY